MPASSGHQPEMGDGRALRSGYRDLHARAIRDGEDLVSLEKSKLAEMLAEANTLQEQVQRPREQAVDSEVFAHLTDRGVELAKKLAHGGKGHTAKDFLRCLKAQFVHTSQAQNDGAEDPKAFAWGEMSDAVAHLFRPAPGVFCMVGPLDAQPKARKAIVRHAKQQLAAVTRPDEVNDAPETAKQETDRNLEEVWDLLKAEQAVPLLELVVNHASFAQTVENLFAVSFLVKDGRVSLTKSENGVLVNRVAPRGDDEATEPEVERMQFVINLTQDVWQQWKQYCDPADARMRHRKPREQGADAVTASPSRASSDDEEEEEAAAAAGSDVAGPASAAADADTDAVGAKPPGSPTTDAAPATTARRGGDGSSAKRKGKASKRQAVSDDEEEAEEAPQPKSRVKRRK